MNADLQQLLAAWLGNEFDDDTLTPIIERLKSDDTFREAFASEVIMHGQLRAVQSSEPRWLELEDLIGASVVDAESDDLESRVMREITTPGCATIAPRKDRHRWQSLALVVGVAASMVGFLAFLFWSSDRIDPNQPPVQQIASDAADVDSDAGEMVGRNGVAVLSQAVDVDWGDACHQGSHFTGWKPMPRSTHDDDQVQLFSRLLVANQRRLYGFILTRVQDRVAADDILQDVSSLLWQKFDKFEPGTDFAAWGMAVSRLTILNWRRKHSKLPLTLDDQQFALLADEAVSVRWQGGALRVWDKSVRRDASGIQ